MPRIAQPSANWRILMGKNRYKPSVSKSARSFLRSIGKNVEPGASILVVTEGVNTEPSYFEAIRSALAAPSVEFVTYGAGRGDPRALTDAAIKFRNARRKKARSNELSISQLEDFEQIWIVFDTDVLKPHKRDDGIAYAQSKGVHIAFSEPCFEYWLLLHSPSHYTTAQMIKCADVEPYLKKAYGWKGYDKNKAECRKLIPPIVTKENVRTAVNASRRVKKHHAGANTPFPANPSTDVDRIIETINQAVSKPNKFL